MENLLGGIKGMIISAAAAVEPALSYAKPEPCAAQKRIPGRPIAFRKTDSLIETPPA